MTFQRVARARGLITTTTFHVIIPALSDKNCDLSENTTSPMKEALVDPLTDLLVGITDLIVVEIDACIHRLWSDNH